MQECFWMKCVKLCESPHGPTEQASAWVKISRLRETHGASGYLDTLASIGECTQRGSMDKKEKVTCNASRHLGSTELTTWNDLMIIEKYGIGAGLEDRPRSKWACHKLATKSVIRGVRVCPVV